MKFKFKLLDWKMCNYLNGNGIEFTVVLIGWRKNGIARITFVQFDDYFGLWRCRLCIHVQCIASFGQ